MNDLARRTFSVAGPVDCTYTNVLDEPFPEAVLQDKQGKNSTAQTDNACVSAVMELPMDTLRVKQIKTLTWHRLRLLQPDLLLWPMKITDTNPDILASSSWFMNFCFQAYWRKHYEVRKHSQNGRVYMRVYCRRDKYFQMISFPSQLLMQLGAGFLSYGDWMFYVSRTKDKSQLKCSVTHHHGSHRCGNGSSARDAKKQDPGMCYSMFDMIWESMRNNLARQICHDAFKVVALARRAAASPATTTSTTPAPSGPTTTRSGRNPSVTRSSSRIATTPSATTALSLLRAASTSASPSTRSAASANTATTLSLGVNTAAPSSASRVQPIKNATPPSVGTNSAPPSSSSNAASTGTTTSLGIGTGTRATASWRDAATTSLMGDLFLGPRTSASSNSSSTLSTGNATSHDETCTCPPGTEIPCMSGRAHIKGEEVRQNFLDRLATTHDRARKCPICNEELFDWVSVNHYFHWKTLKYIVKHMNEEHQAGLPDIPEKPLL